MTTSGDAGAAYIEKIIRARGYAHPSHRVLAANDLTVLEALNAIPTATYARQRRLTSAQKELILIPAFVCLHSPDDIVRVHIRKARRLGASEAEIRDTVELIAFEAGFGLFERAVIAWSTTEGGEDRPADVTAKREEDMSDRRQDVLMDPSVAALCDAETVGHLHAFQDHVMLRQRSLDARTKWLVTIGMLACLKARPERIEAHMAQAISEGVEPGEILEALELLITPAGLPVFEIGATAWSRAVAGSTDNKTPEETK